MENSRKMFELVRANTKSLGRLLSKNYYFIF
jgi:hypothetical protein